MQLIDKKADVINAIKQYLANDDEELTNFLNELIRRTEKVKPNIISKGIKYNKDIETFGKLDKESSYKNNISIVINGISIEIQSDYFKKNILDQVFKHYGNGAYNFGEKPKTIEATQVQIFKFICILSLHELKWKKHYEGDEKNQKKVIKKIWALCVENTGLKPFSKPTFNKYWNKM